MDDVDGTMATDFLAMFDGLEDAVELATSEGALVPSLPSQVERQPLPTTSSSQLVQVPKEVFQNTVPLKRSKRLKLDAKALSWYRHFCKAKKKIHTDESTVLDALIELQKKHKTGKHSVAYNVKRLKRKKSGLCKRSLVLQAKMKVGGGNRFARQFSMLDFLEVAFGEKSAKKHFHLVGNIAAHFNMSRETVGLMRTTVAASVMTKQVKTAARVFALCKRSPPVTVAVRHAWDETAQDINVNLLGEASSRSAWKVMVQKVSIMIFWSGCSLTMDLVS